MRNQALIRTDLQKIKNADFAGWKLAQRGFPALTQPAENPKTKFYRPKNFKNIQNSSKSTQCQPAVFTKKDFCRLDSIKTFRFPNTSTCKIWFFPILQAGRIIWFPKTKLLCICRQQFRMIPSNFLLKANTLPKRFLPYCKSLSKLLWKLSKIKKNKQHRHRKNTYRTWSST